MSISFASAVGNLFNRLGKLGLLVKQLDAYQAAQLTNMTNTTNGVVAQYDAESDIQAQMGSSYIGILNGSGGGVGSTVQQIAVSTVNRTVFRDSALLNQTLTQNNTLGSIQDIIRQMKIAGATVYMPMVTITPQTVTGQPGPQFVGNGSGVMVTSIRRAVDGLTQQNAFAETLTATCIQDSYIGNAVAGNEFFSFTGEGNQINPFAFNWPLGSNTSINLQAIDGNQDNQAGNLLTNSGFNDWTSDVPDNWTISAGSSTITEDTGITYDGDAALKMTGDGATLTTLYQEFDSSTGTLGQLNALTQVAFNGFFRRDGVAPGAGTLQIALVNDQGAIIKDQNGVDNAFTIDCTTLTTVYTSYSGVFRLPLVTPSVIRIQISLTVALTSSRAIYIDKCALGQMTLCYASGPSVAIFSGNNNFAQGDYAQAITTNSRAADGSLNTFQTLVARILPDFMANGLLLPSSLTPTISDTALIA